MFSQGLEFDSVWKWASLQLLVLVISSWVICNLCKFDTWLHLCGTLLTCTVPVVAVARVFRLKYKQTGPKTYCRYEYFGFLFQRCS